MIPGSVDAIFVAGLVLLSLAVPLLASAVADRRPPLPAAILFVLGGGAVVWAWVSDTACYGDVTAWPDIVVAVIARLLN